jgi:transcriptional/translational regulatory protein YebC/TACO1
MGTAGCVAWLFEHRGVITLEADKQNPDDLALIAIDAGAEDVRVDDGFVEVLTKPQDFPWVKSALEKRHLPIASAELSMVPKTYVRVNEKATLQTMHLIEALEELEDVRQVYTNMDIPEELVTQYESSATR